MRERRWNSELPLIYPAVILRKNPGSFKAAKIKQKIEQMAHPPLAPIAEAEEAEENPAAAENNADGGNAAGAEEEEAQPTPGGAGETTAGGGVTPTPRWENPQMGETAGGQRILSPCRTSSMKS